MVTEAQNKNPVNVFVSGDYLQSRAVNDIIYTSSVDC